MLAGQVALILAAAFARAFDVVLGPIADLCRRRLDVSF
jgi:hypothetical protein